MVLTVFSDQVLPNLPLFKILPLPALYILTAYTHWDTIAIDPLVPHSLDSSGVFT